MLPRFSMAASLFTSTPSSPCPRALGEDDVENRGQQLRAETHREGDGEQQRLHDRAREQHVHGEHGDDQHRHRAGEKDIRTGARPDRTRSPAAAGGGDRRSRRRLCRLSGRHDEDTGRPGADVGPHEHGVDARREGSARVDRPDALLSGKCFAGEDRFVDVQVGGLPQESVGRNQRTGGQDDQVAGNDIRRGDSSCTPPRIDLRFDGQPRAQARNRVARAALPPEADARARHQDGEHDGAVRVFTRHDRHHGGESEDPDQRALDLLVEQSQRRQRPLGREHVGTKRHQSPRRLLGSQPAGVGADLARDVLGRPGPVRVRGRAHRQKVPSSAEAASRPRAHRRSGCRRSRAPPSGRPEAGSSGSPGRSSGTSACRRSRRSAGRPRSPHRRKCRVQIGRDVPAVLRRADQTAGVPQAPVGEAAHVDHSRRDDELLERNRRRAQPLHHDGARPHQEEPVVAADGGDRLGRVGRVTARIARQPLRERGVRAEAEASSVTRRVAQIEDQPPPARATRRPR